MESLNITKLKRDGILSERDRIVRTGRLAKGSVGDAFDVVTRGERYIRDGQVIWVRRIGRLDKVRQKAGRVLSKLNAIF